MKKAKHPKHTPGPWRVERISGVAIGVGRVISSVGGGTYSEIVCNSILPDTDEEYALQKSRIEADMRLIAAAPEMLKTLEIVADTIEGLYGEHRVRAIIKKAKGI